MLIIAHSARTQLLLSILFCYFVIIKNRIAQQQQRKKPLINNKLESQTMAVLCLCLDVKICFASMRDAMKMFVRRSFGLLSAFCFDMITNPERPLYKLRIVFTHIFVVVVWCRMNSSRLSRQLVRANARVRVSTAKTVIKLCALANAH